MIKIQTGIVYTSPIKVSKDIVDIGICINNEISIYRFFNKDAIEVMEAIKGASITFTSEEKHAVENYDVIEVTFKQEGGGKDFEDQYYYWINKKSHTMDYLAYNYKVNGGGVRFRSSYNRRNVGGIIFQDYINYKAEVGTPLKDLPTLYENDKLKEVSRIDTENVELIQ